MAYALKQTIALRLSCGSGHTAGSVKLTEVLTECRMQMTLCFDW